jgi:ATP-binding cassette subfamily B protein
MGLKLTNYLKVGKMFNRLQRVFKHYYCVKQFDETDCGAACIATVAKQYGLKVPITQIRRIAGTDIRGTNALGLIKAANQLCFTAKGIRVTPEQLMDADDLPLPMIAHVAKDKLLHYVVIHEITKKEIIVADPAEGIKCYKPDDFFSIWSGVLIILQPDEKFEQGDETRGLFARFLHLIIPHKRLLVEIVLASMLLTIFGLLGTFYFKYLIDDILPDNLTNTLHIISIGMLVLHIFRIILGVFRGQLLLYLSRKIDIKMILDYYQHILSLPISFFDSRKVGEILSRLNDAAKIRNAVSGSTISVLLDSLTVIAGGVILFLQNKTLFMITLMTIPLYAAIVWGFSKPYRNINRTIMQQGSEFESFMVESVSGAFTIKAFNGQDEAGLETEQYYIKQTRSIFKSVWLNNIQSSLQGLLTVISEVLIIWIGSDLVIQGNLSMGQLLTFNALAGYFTGPMKSLIGLQFTLQEAYVAADRLGEILDLEVEEQHEDRKVKLVKLTGEIEFQKINFRYGTRELVLDDVNLKIKPGEKLALVGGSGSGKTTLVKLLLKYYLPEKGEIIVDGYNIQDISSGSIRERIGYVPQEIFLFSGTIRENIAFGNSGASIEAIIDAAKQAQAHEFINELPLRYETLVGERGSTLSGGQRQRIGIARAILKKPDLLILDEATSNLDSITERAFHETIQSISQNLTTVIIAHRLSTIRRCDKIVVMEKGKIIESGSHHELLAQRGMYYQLWQDQIGEDIEPKALGEGVS